LPVLECSRCNELYYSAHGSTELSCDACGGLAWRVFEDEVSFARVSGLSRTLQPGDHAVLLYTDHAQAVEFCGRYLQDGLERGERLLIAVPAELRRAVIARVGATSMESAIVLDAERLYGPDFDPEATAREYDRIVKQLDGPARMLSGPDGECAAGIDPEALHHYERVAHQLVLDLGVTALCVYDGRRLPMAFSPVAIDRHPLISRNGADLCRNGDFRYEPA
jgi:MEDS: MEthanogen/methylotroph, DcmR Sensory domain